MSSTELKFFKIIFNFTVSCGFSACIGFSGMLELNQAKNNKPPGNEVFYANYQQFYTK